MGSAASIDEVDVFAREMLTRSPKIDSLSFVLNSSSGKEAFMTFLREEYSEENLWFFMVRIRSIN